MKNSALAPSGFPALSERIRVTYRQMRSGLNVVLVGSLTFGHAFEDAYAADDQGRAEWSYSTTPYVWLINTTLSLGLPVQNPGALDRSEPILADFKDRFDFGAQIHFEGQREAFGFILDGTNLQLSDLIDRQRYDLKTDSAVTVIEAAGLWAPWGNNQSRTELLAGIRFLDASLDVTLRPNAELLQDQDFSLNQILLDLMVGVRQTWRLGDAWQLRARADVASGDTDFSWNSALLARYHVSDWGDLVLGYRYIDVDLKSNVDLLNPKITVHGPMIGFAFDL